MSVQPHAAPSKVERLTLDMLAPCLDSIEDFAGDPDNVFDGFPTGIIKRRLTLVDTSGERVELGPRSTLSWLGPGKFVIRDSWTYRSVAISRDPSGGSEQWAVELLKQPR